MDWIELLRIGTGGGLLWMRQWTSGFHKMRGISWLAENMLASQDGLCCMEWRVTVIICDGDVFSLEHSRRKFLYKVLSLRWEGEQGRGQLCLYTVGFKLFMVPTRNEMRQSRKLLKYFKRYCTVKYSQNQNLSHSTCLIFHPVNLFFHSFIYSPIA
jgi:hypothetical protein